MPDVLTPQQRQRCMSHIRNKATKPEILVRKWLWTRIPIQVECQERTRQTGHRLVELSNARKQSNRDLQQNIGKACKNVEKVY